MIRKVTLRNWKRFADVTFTVPGHLVLAGPNNTGKTTLLQAIAAWAFGCAKWDELGTDGNPRKNGHPWQDLERGQFGAVALRSFDLLWTNRRRTEPMEIGIQIDGEAAAMVLEFKFRAQGLAQVRPRHDFPVALMKLVGPPFTTTFIPAIGGLAREERRLADKESIHDLLAQARAGEVLRNLLVLAHNQQDAWDALNDSLKRMFGVVLLPPTRGAELTCEYKRAEDADDAAAPSFDVASAGSGVLQVLLVLSLMLTQRGVLLIDEPDAHLHLILQKTIYAELRSVAARNKSQLIIATHSEQVIDSVDPRELCLMDGTPRLVADSDEKAELVRSLGVLTHGDLLYANGASGVLYTEDFTDLDTLEAVARRLGDETALKLLSVQLVKKRAKAASPAGLGDLSPAKHWAMLKLISDPLPALELLDGDSLNKDDDLLLGSAQRMQRLRWCYYEIESYLLHPAALRRFFEKTLGGAGVAVEAAMTVLEDTLEQRFLDDPSNLSPLQLTYLRNEAVSKTLIPAMLRAAGLNTFPKTRLFEIAQCFEATEVHPEVRYKLAQIKAAFGAGPMPPAYDEFLKRDV